MTDTDYHKIIFGLTEDEMTAALEADESGWLESDYQEARHLLYKIERGYPEHFKAFLESLQDLEGLDDFTLQQRCRFIYFVASQHIDWRDTNHQVVDLGDKGATTLLYEKVYTGEPTINIDFQHIIDQVRQFNPSPEQIEAWVGLFGNALKHQPAQGEVSSGIVRDAGKMRKHRRK